MSVNWADVLVQQHAKGAARSAGEPPGASTGLARMTTNAPRASTLDTRTGQPQRGSHSQSHGVLYSPSSPRMHTPLAAAHKALRALHTSSNVNKPSRSASHTGEHSGAQQSPEEIARNDLQRKLTNSGRAHVGGLTGSTESGAATQRSKSGRAREPQATPQRGTAAPVDSNARSTRHVTHRPRKGKVYCGQNKLDPSLRVNGGSLEVGTRSRCFRAGFGGALHQRIDDEAEFVRKFTAEYAPLVVQKLWYKDGPPPQGEGYQPATLSQARQRGWGAGSAALARKLQKKLHGESAGAGRARTRSASTRSASPSQ
jgi:hypothetical protein